jgi:hypothetical protein
MPHIGAGASPAISITRIPLRAILEEPPKIQQVISPLDLKPLKNKKLIKILLKCKQIKKYFSFFNVFF